MSAHFLRRRHDRSPAPSAPAVAMTDSQRRTTLMAVALLMDYPSEDTCAEILDGVSGSLEGLPQATAEPLAHFVATAWTMGTRALAVHYVETFDQRRRCTPYLSYYATGDTRQRGMALLSFHALLSATGLELTSRRSELPDHLSIVCEAAAREPGNPDNGDAIAAMALAAHREGIEVLRHALHDRQSPYVDVIDALITTLPALSDETRRRYLELVTTGPPTEMVGITDLPFPMIRQENHA